jgi:hypothetical protein
LNLDTSVVVGGGYLLLVEFTLELLLFLLVQRRFLLLIIRLEGFSSPDPLPLFVKLRLAAETPEPVSFEPVLYVHPKTGWNIIPPRDRKEGGIGGASEAKKVLRERVKRVVDQVAELILGCGDVCE